MASDQSLGHLSLPFIAKLKHKAHAWRVLSHDHVTDQAMAIGFKCPSVAKHASMKWDQAKLAQKQGAVPMTSVDEHDHEEGESGLQSNNEAIANILNNGLGSGIIAIPHAFKGLGVIGASVMLLLSCSIHLFLVLLVLKSCDIADVHPASYNAVGRKAYGATGRTVVVLTFIFMATGCLISYAVGCFDALTGLFKEQAGYNLDEHSFCGLSAAVWMVVLLNFPPTYIRSLNSVATLSFIAFLAACVIVICVVYHCGKLLSIRGLPASSDIVWFPESKEVFLANLPIIVFAFAIQAGTSIILSSLKTDTMANKTKVGGQSFGLLLLISLVVAIPSYLTYLSAIPGDVLNAMTEPNSPEVILARCAMVVLVVLSYMFMMIPLRLAAFEGLFGMNEAKEEGSYGMFAAITTISNIVIIGVAANCKDISVVLGVVGAVGANLVAFILPCMIYIKVRSQPSDKSFEAVPIFSASNIPYVCLIIYSLYAMTTGVMGLV